MTAMLEVDGLHVRRGKRVVNDRIAFTTATNQVLVIVGPNGAGKTTLLDAIAGLVPASGSVRFRGLELHGLRDRARVISYMPDDLVLPEEMSISRSLGLTSDAANVAVLGVAALLDRRGNALSRGEAKRCQLAAALAMPRPVVLLDEPLGAFDPRQLRDVIPVVRAAASDRTIILTVHQLRTAELIADRVLLLSEGRVLASGSVAELRERAGLPEGPFDEVFIALLGERAV